MKYAIWNSKYVIGIPNTYSEFQIPYSEFQIRIWNSKYAIRNSKFVFGIPNMLFGILNTISNMVPPNDRVILPMLSTSRTGLVLC